YRLNVIPIDLRALRERRGDSPLLVSHFLRGTTRARTGAPFQITRQTMEVLDAHHWPGNVRELENAIERACALCEDSVIRVTDLPLPLQQYFKESPSDTVFNVPSAPSQTEAAPPGQALYPVSGTAGQSGQSAADAVSNRPLGPLKVFLREQELSYLNRALAYTGGDKEKAAELLDVSLATLYRKLSEDEAL